MRIDICNAQYLSPIIIDVTGEGFWLTDKAHGVKFRRGAGDPLEQMSWTDPAHHNAWLVRPNADGSVTSLSLNLFGNLSPQPSGPEPNGYRALAWWAEQDGCGKVNQLDAKSCPVVWSQLRLWHDANQDGIAQPSEVVTLAAAGVSSISLQYHESWYVDRYGNKFRFVSKIKDAAGHEADRCYDVFLLSN
jgi:hypothetical protein